MLKRLTPTSAPPCLTGNANPAIAPRLELRIQTNLTRTEPIRAPPSSHPPTLNTKYALCSAREGHRPILNPPDQRKSQGQLRLGRSFTTPQIGCPQTLPAPLHTNSITMRQFIYSGWMGAVPHRYTRWRYRKGRLSRRLFLTGSVFVLTTGASVVSQVSNLQNIGLVFSHHDHRHE